MIAFEITNSYISTFSAWGSREYHIVTTHHMIHCLAALRHMMVWTRITSTGNVNISGYKINIRKQHVIQFLRDFFFEDLSVRNVLHCNSPLNLITI